MKSNAPSLIAATAINIAMDGDQDDRYLAVACPHFLHEINSRQAIDAGPRWRK